MDEVKKEARRLRNVWLMRPTGRALGSGSHSRMLRRRFAPISTFRPVHLCQASRMRLRW
jgi:hypothetical protein